MRSRTSRRTAAPMPTPARSSSNSHSAQASTRPPTKNPAGTTREAPKNTSTMARVTITRAGTNNSRGTSISNSSTTVAMVEAAGTTSTAATAAGLLAAREAGAGTASRGVGITWAIRRTSSLLAMAVEGGCGMMRERMRSCGELPSRRPPGARSVCIRPRGRYCYGRRRKREKGDVVVLEGERTHEA